MNMKRLVWTFVVVLVLSSVGNFVIHGMLLQPTYQQTPQLLRTPEDGAAHAPFLILSFAFFSLAFVWIYAHGVEEKPWLGQGLRYGLAMWLIASVSRYVTYYAIQPWSPNVVGLQIGLELIMLLLLGVVTAAIYRK